MFPFGRLDIWLSRNPHASSDSGQPCDTVSSGLCLPSNAPSPPGVLVKLEPGWGRQTGTVAPGPWKGKEPSPLCWWLPHQSLQLEKPECVPTDEESFLSWHLRQEEFPWLKEWRIQPWRGRGVGQRGGGGALVSLCHVCCPTHTATQNSVTICFQLPEDTRASLAPSAITKSEFKHQLSWPLSPPPPFFPFFLIIQVCLLEKREGDNVCRAFNLLPKE